jgi:hypothetical protein
VNRSEISGGGENVLLNTKEVDVREGRESKEQEQEQEIERRGGQVKWRSKRRLYARLT